MASSASLMAIAITALLVLTTHPVSSFQAATRGEAPACAYAAQHCPNFIKLYDDKKDDVEIRRYDRSAWISTKLKADSFENAMSDGLTKIFKFIDGQNKSKKKFPLTTPLIVDVYSRSLYAVSVPLPSPFAIPVDADCDIQIRHWGPAYVAVNKFEGFATHSSVIREAIKLRKLLGNTRWYRHTLRAGTGQSSPAFSVAIYNSLKPSSENYNEVWLHISPGFSPAPVSSESPAPTPLEGDFLGQSPYGFPRKPDGAPSPSEGESFSPAPAPFDGVFLWPYEPATSPSDYESPSSAPAPAPSDDDSDLFDFWLDLIDGESAPASSPAPTPFPSEDSTPSSASPPSDYDEFSW